MVSKRTERKAIMESVKQMHLYSVLLTVRS